jgi:hypothetical protein
MMMMMPMLFGVIFLLIIDTSISQQPPMLLMHGINHPAAANIVPADYHRLTAGRDDALLGAPDRADFFGGHVPIDALIDPDGRPIEIIRRKQLINNDNGSQWQTSLSVWLWSLFGCGCVVACGILPVYLLPVDTGNDLHRSGECFLNLRSTKTNKISQNIIGC